MCGDNLNQHISLSSFQIKFQQFILSISMSFLSTVTGLFAPNQTGKSQALGGSFALIMKNLWKSSSPTSSKDSQADSPKYELLEKADKEEFDHLQDSEWDDQFEDLKLVLLDEEEEDYEYEDEEEDDSYEKLKDLSESLDEADARLDWVVKDGKVDSSLSLDSLSLTSSITTDSGAQSDSDFLWSEDEEAGSVGSLGSSHIL